MRKPILILLILVVYVGSYLIVYYSGKPGSQITSQLATTFFPMFAGLLIGAVGVFLGSLGNLYVLIPKNDRQRQRKILEDISSAVIEVRHDTLFVVISCGVVLVLQYLRFLDIPGVIWPISHQMLSKDIFIDSIAVCVSALSFYAIYDCVKTMFTLHYHYQEIVKNK